MDTLLLVIFEVLYYPPSRSWENVLCILVFPQMKTLASHLGLGEGCDYLMELGYFITEKPGEFS